MAYKINVNGIQIEADTLKEALALARELSASATKTPVPSKPTWEFPVHQQAKPQNAITNPFIKAAPAAAFAPDIPAEFQSPRIYVNEASMAAAFLSKIVESGDKGVESKELMSIVGADHPRGFGAKTRPVKRVLSQLGYVNPDNVYQWLRVHEGKESVWLPGPLIDEALEKTKAAAGRNK